MILLEKLFEVVYWFGDIIADFIAVVIKIKREDKRLSFFTKSEPKTKRGSGSQTVMNRHKVVTL